MRSPSFPPLPVVLLPGYLSLGTGGSYSTVVDPILDFSMKSPFLPLRLPLWFGQGAILCALTFIQKTGFHSCIEVANLPKLDNDLIQGLFSFMKGDSEFVDKISLIVLFVKYNIKCSS